MENKGITVLDVAPQIPLKVALSQCFVNSRSGKCWTTSCKQSSLFHITLQALTLNHSHPTRHSGVQRWSTKFGTRQGVHLPNGGGKGNTGTRQNIWHYALHITHKLRLLGHERVYKKDCTNTLCTTRTTILLCSLYGQRPQNAMPGWKPFSGGRPRRPTTWLIDITNCRHAMGTGPFFWTSQRVLNLEAETRRNWATASGICGWAYVFIINLLCKLNGLKILEFFSYV